MPRLHTRSLLAFLVIALVITGLAIWTLESPTALFVQSESQLESSIISFSKTTADYNISDSSGTYTFRFGFDHPDQPISLGAKTVFKVYTALISQKFASPFTRGVSLVIESATLLVDGRPDSGVKVVSILQPSLVIYEFEFVNTSISSGAHNVSARLLLSTVDVNYIGYFRGTSQLVMLNGTFSIE